MVIAITRFNMNMCIVMFMVVKTYLVDYFKKFAITLI